ncbi:MAG: sigma-70 family RNA polymerase sigma factor [Kiritimatiellae bacterium]|nr:sigma-70 family RNA polymerase sigma factor [Kiritimatiellia bacterium]
MTIEAHYNSIAPKLTNWLVSSGSSYHEACDLVQNTFLKIWKMRDDLRDDEGAVSGLAFTIARNLRKNLARDDSRMTFVDEIKDEDAGTTGPAALPSDAAYLRRRLKEAFARLPPVLREAYTLFQVAEMSISDIARQTGVTDNLVKVRIFRAKQKLREILSDLGDVANPSAGGR